MQYAVENRVFQQLNRFYFCYSTAFNYNIITLSHAGSVYTGIRLSLSVVYIL